MSLDYRVVIDGDGVARFVGVDFSNGSKPIRVVARKTVTIGAAEVELIAFKFPGGKCWAGIGMDRTTVHATYEVWQVTKRNNEGDIYVDRLMEWPVVGERPRQPQPAPDWLPPSGKLKL